MEQANSQVLAPVRQNLLRDEDAVVGQLFSEKNAYHTLSEDSNHVDSGLQDDLVKKKYSQV